jgi:hypothetical protein
MTGYAARFGGGVGSGGAKAWIGEREGWWSEDRRYNFNSNVKFTDCANFNDEVNNARLRRKSRRPLQIQVQRRARHAVPLRRK